jgi:hypothetical protein
VTREGLDGLHEALQGRTSALSGPSGVGKSSLMNAMYPGLDRRVGAISESVNKGRHTTVGALMHPLPDEGYVVDTPGLREIGLWGLASAALDQCFPEFRPAAGNCRFADCRHVSEPGCAVRERVTTGGISPARYESYVKLREEVAEAEVLGDVGVLVLRRDLDEPLGVRVGRGTGAALLGGPETDPVVRQAAVALQLEGQERDEGESATRGAVDQGERAALVAGNRVAEHALERRQDEIAAGHDEAGAQLPAPPAERVGEGAKVAIVDRTGHGGGRNAIGRMDGRRNGRRRSDTGDEGRRRQTDKNEGTAH